MVCQIIESTDAKTLNGFVKRIVSDKVDLVATDEHLGYSSLNAIGFLHESVSHKQGEYVRSEVHTADLGPFWALLKRRITGAYYNVSKKHLPLYLAGVSVAS